MFKTLFAGATSLAGTDIRRTVEGNEPSNHPLASELARLGEWMPTLRFEN